MDTNGEDKLRENQPEEVSEGEKAENEEKKEKGKMETVFKEIMSWVWTIICAVAVAFFITQVIIVNANVPTGSMENTIMPNDRIIANRLAYKFSDPERYDIVVFRYPDDESILYVKRIIGLPGETIEVIDGKVYVDGIEEPLKDDFIKEEMFEGAKNFGPYEVPEDSYFMMGDNRNNSNDSRMWVNKFVKRNKILGKVVFRYMPNFAYLADK